VESERSQGTKFTLRLPLTLAIIKAILFTYGEETYAIPLSSVTEIVRVIPENLEMICGRPVLRHRNDIVPIISIDGLPRHNGKSFVVLIGIAHMRTGVAVDKIVGEEELVIKALDEKAAGRIASGASILGNGRVVLILDPLSLVRRAFSQGDEAERTIWQQSEQ
jgi:two-component system chemotaxis sensor kinase CheA